jgi:hypothetical protein
LIVKSIQVRIPSNSGESSSELRSLVCNPYHSLINFSKINNLLGMKSHSGGLIKSSSDTGGVVGSSSDSLSLIKLPKEAERLFYALSMIRKETFESYGNEEQSVETLDFLDFDYLFHYFYDRYFLQVSVGNDLRLEPEVTNHPEESTKDDDALLARDSAIVKMEVDEPHKLQRDAAEPKISEQFSESHSQPVLKPLKGWSSSSSTSFSSASSMNDSLASNTTNNGSKTNEWIDYRCCVFCANNEENDILGRLLPYSDGALAHVNCLLWCSEVTVIGAQLVNAETARQRCSSQLCYFCLKRGATINCCYNRPSSLSAANNQNENDNSNRGNSNSKANARSAYNKSLCRRAYHLRCAKQSSSCLLFEKIPGKEKRKCIGSGKDDEETEDSFSGSLFEGYCPEHVPLSLSGQVLSSHSSSSLLSTSMVLPSKPHCLYRVWQPTNPLRCLVIETCSAKIEMENIANLLSQGRNDIAVKIGSLSILKIGAPITSSEKISGFSTKKAIYPHHFLSARIYWSAKHPLKRTVHFFEILEKNDFENWDLRQLGYLQKSLSDTKNFQSTKNEAQSQEAEEGDWLSGAIFRAVSVDNLEQPIFSKSVDSLHRFLMMKIKQCQSMSATSSSSFALTSMPSFPRERQSYHSYNLTSHQFFGLGLSFVQEAIELIPDSVISMISLDKEEQDRYSPYYRLPTNADVMKVLQSQSSTKSKSVNSSVNGACRADPYQENSKRENISVRISTTKTVGNDGSDGATVDSCSVGGRSSSTAASGTGAGGEEFLTDIVDFVKENSKVEQEIRKTKYLEMTKAYLFNPFSRLEVKKSRIHGFGLFAKINFQRDDVIVEYIGEKIRQTVADRREMNYELEGVGSCYLFRSVVLFLFLCFADFLSCHCLSVCFTASLFIDWTKMILLTLQRSGECQDL